MLIREVQDVEKNAFNSLVLHPLQSWEWGEFREKMGVGVLRFGEFKNSTLRNCFQLTIHPIPHTPYTVGYLPRSPFPNHQILKALKKIGQEKNCLFIKIEPDVLQDTKDKLPGESWLLPGKPILPVNTFLINLSLSEGELLKRMHEKTRYNIKIAQKHGVEIKERDDSQSLEIFLKFLQQTQKRQGFYTHPSEYFRQQWQILKPANMVYLLLAFYKDTPIASVLLLRFRDKLYYTYGGSSELYREKMPNHLLHWEAIQLGKKLGCKIYDFWGAYLEKPESSDPWYGLFRFKAGFGGEFVSYVGAFDLILNPFLYRVYGFADNLRWKFLRAKARLPI
ncbi:MAG: lipid II:glycine glycyltransferase FemX [Patescibacteria group bacterium]